MGRKVVSFSLYGNNPKYCLGIIENIENIYRLLKGWYIYIYYDNVPIKLIEFLGTFDMVKLIKCDIETDYEWVGMFWRFYQFDDDTDIWLSRDADSRINERDVMFIKSWLNTNYACHIIRDDKYQSCVIMGGMFGINNKEFKKYKRHSIKEWIEIYKNKYSANMVRSVDQKFLRREIYPSISHNNLTHIGCDEVRMNKNDILILPNENDELCGQQDKIKDETYLKYSKLL